MNNENISTEQRYKTLMIIWLALFVSQFMFLIVLYVIKPELYQLDLTKPILGENGIIILAFAFIGLFNLVVSFLMKKNLLNSSVEYQNPALVQNAVIIACAMCESISLFGFVLAFAFDFQFFFLFFIFGITGMIFHFPKRENLHLATYKKTQEL